MVFWEPWALGLAALVGFSAALWIVSRWRTERRLRALELQAKSLRGSLEVSQQKFYANQFDEGVFNALLSDYQQRLTEIEFQANALRGENKVNVDDAFNKLSKKVSKLTKSQKHRLQSLLAENASAIHEIKVLEQKLAKRELEPGAFQELSKKKHQKSIEAQLKIKELLRENDPEKTQNT